MYRPDQFCCVCGGRSHLDRCPIFTSLQEAVIALTKRIRALEKDEPGSVVDPGPGVERNGVLPADSDLHLQDTPVSTVATTPCSNDRCDRCGERLIHDPGRTTSWPSDEKPSVNSAGTTHKG